VLVPVTVAGGAVTNARCVGVPGVTVTALLMAVVSVRVVSVAVSAHEPALVILSAENVAIPATAVAVVVPPSLHVVTVGVREITSLSPVVELTTTPLPCSTATVNGARLVPAGTGPAGCVLKATCVGVLLLRATELLVAVVTEREPSVAVNAQGVPPVKSAAVKFATPPLAAIVSVPPTVQPAELVVILIVSPFPVFDPVSTLPYWSSTETVKGMATPNVPSAAGCAVKTTCEGEVGVTVTALLVAVPPAVVSVAVNVHEVPVVIETALKVSELPVAAPDNVPVKEQVDEIAMLSVVPVPPVYVTVKGASVEPATTGEGNAAENDTLAAEAAAGRTPTTVTPASKRAAPTLTPRSDFALVVTERPLRLTIFMD
jgi:hypothetical protein